MEEQNDSPQTTSTTTDNNNDNNSVRFEQQQSNAPSCLSSHCPQIIIDVLATQGMVLPGLVLTWAIHQGDEIWDQVDDPKCDQERYQSVC